MTLIDHRPGFAIAVMGLAAVLLAAPALASAEHGDRRSRSEDGRRGHAVREDDRHRGQREYARHEHRGHHLQHDRRHYQRRAAHHRHRAAFLCKPCLHRFASRDRFQRHLRRRHHVSARRLSRLIDHRTPGWVFFGGGR
jgi:hypothetical protein